MLVTSVLPHCPNLRLLGLDMRRFSGLTLATHGQKIIEVWLYYFLTRPDDVVDTDSERQKVAGLNDLPNLKRVVIPDQTVEQLRMLTAGELPLHSRWSYFANYLKDRSVDIVDRNGARITAQIFLKTLDTHFVCETESESESEYNDDSEMTESDEGEDATVDLARRIRQRIVSVDLILLNLFVAHPFEKRQRELADKDESDDEAEGHWTYAAYLKSLHQSDIEVSCKWMSTVKTLLIYFIPGRRAIGK
jgi:hypothetical protein